MNSATWNSQPDACAATTAGAQGPDRITRTGYDAVGRVETVTTGYGVDPIVATAATFTDNGRLATLTDGEGNRTNYERSEESSVGEECVSTGRSRWSP